MNKFMEYIDELILVYQEEEQKLIKEDCKDEANFAKIKMNICEIAKTLYKTAEKKYQGNEAAIKSEFLNLMTKIPANWRAAYDRAKENGDVNKIVIEEIKLETVQILLDKFQQLS